MKIIRWILVIPVSMLSWVCAYFVVVGLYWLRSIFGFIDPTGGDDIDYTIPYWHFFLTSNLVAAASFVYVGSKIAPIQRRQGARMLAVLGWAALIGLIISAVVLSEYLDTSSESIFRGVVGFVGGFIGFTTGFLYDKEE